MEQIKTITTEEAAERLRSLGMRISTVSLRDGLERGVFPFGDYLQGEKNRVFIVYEKLLNAWIAERAERTEVTA